MKTLMALVAVSGSHEGPWQRAKGLERGIIVEKLGEGEVIEVQYEHDRQLLLPYHIRTDGYFPFPQCSRYKVSKIGVSDGVSPETNVTVHIE